MPSHVLQSVGVVVGTTVLTALASLVTVIAFLRSFHHTHEDVSSRTLKRFRRVTNSDALRSTKAYFEAQVQHQECYEHARMLIRENWRYRVGLMLTAVALAVCAAIYSAPAYLWFKADQRRALFGWVTEQIHRTSSGEYSGLYYPQGIAVLCLLPMVLLLMSALNYSAWSQSVTGINTKLDRPISPFIPGLFEFYMMMPRLSPDFIGTRAYLRTVVAMKRSPVPYTDPAIYLLDEDFRCRYLIEYQYELDIRRRVYRRLTATTKVAILAHGFRRQEAFSRRRKRLKRARNAYLTSAAKLEGNREAYAHLTLGKDRQAHGSAAPPRPTRSSDPAAPPIPRRDMR